MRSVQKFVIPLLLMLFSWQLVYASGQPHVDPGSHCAAFERYHQQVACAAEAIEQGQAEQGTDGHVECGVCWTVSLPAATQEHLPIPPKLHAPKHGHIEPHFTDNFPAEPERPNWTA
jgi:hypothetical protein